MGRHKVLYSEEISSGIIVDKVKVSPIATGTDIGKSINEVLLFIVQLLKSLVVYCFFAL